MQNQYDPSMVTREAIVAVVRRPGLWGEAIRVSLAMAPDGWWRRAPFLPLPDPAYLRWRVTTAYGRADTTIATGDLVAYLAWCKRQRSQG
jgi:hypothetical protein